MRQDKLNQEMVVLGKERYSSKKTKATDIGAESNTIPGRTLLNNSTDILSKAIQNWLVAANSGAGRRHTCLPLLSQLCHKKIAVITSKTVIDCLSKERRLTGTAVEVGRAVEDEILIQTLSEEEPNFIRKIQNKTFKRVGQKLKRRFLRDAAKAVDLISYRWTKSEALSVGVLLIEMLAEYTGIIEIRTKVNERGRKYCIIQPSKDIIEWVAKCHEYHEALEPVFLPMVEKPLAWSNPWYGGYRSMEWRPRPLVKSRDKKFQETLSSSLPSAVYEAVNFIQNTPWKINKQTLNLVKEAWDSGLILDSLPPSANDPIPSKPIDIDDNPDARRQWRKAAAKVHFQNESYESQRILTLKCLFVAQKMSENKRIWFPHQLDFRGRGYPLPLFLNPQSVSYAKAILEFADGKQVKTDDDVLPLYIHAANKFGLDKQTFNKRVAWVEENKNLISKIAQDPWGHREWTKADEPFAFYASCVELSSLWDVGSEYVTHLPVGMDATTQGLQIYSMLLRDEVAAAATNVLPSEVPSDPYKSVADKVIQRLKNINTEDARFLLSLGLDRTTTKRQTMTLPYGLTQHSCITYTKEWLEEKLKKSNIDQNSINLYQLNRLLGNTIWESIGDVVGSAQVGMRFIRECVKAMVENDVTPFWNTPLGFPVRMRYENYDSITVSTKVGAKAKLLSLRVENGVQSLRKALNGGPANFVHSLDGFGGLLGETVLACKALGINHLGAVHDQLMCLAPDYKKVSLAVRQSTVKLFSEEIFRNFRDSTLTLLPSSAMLPDVPKYGALDVTKVLTSDYYFN